MCRLASERGANRRIDRDKATAAKVLKDMGWTLDRLGELFGTTYGSIKRWIDWLEKNPPPSAEEPTAGPNETVIRSLVADWNLADKGEHAKAELLLTFAVVADKGRFLNASGIALTAAVAAGKELKAMLADLGQSSGFEDLRKALTEE